MTVLQTKDLKESTAAPGLFLRKRPEGRKTETRACQGWTQISLCVYSVVPSSCLLLLFSPEVLFRP